MNIDFDIDKILWNGMINYLYYDDMLNLEEGKCYYRNRYKDINVCNNDLITDAAILVHEFSHLRKQIVVIVIKSIIFYERTGHFR